MSTYQVDTDGGSYEVTTDDTPQPSALEAAGHAAVNNFPFGGQMAAGAKSLMNDNGYSKNLADFNAQTPIDKAAHPVAYGAGAVAGAAAPLLIPGAGEALEAAPVAMNAGIGAADALGNTDLTKNPGDIAKKGIEGALTGGAIGKAGDLAGKAIGSMSSMGKRLEANATANAFDLGTYGVRKLGKGDANPEEVLTDLNEKVGKLLPGLVGLTDTSASKYQKLLQAKEAAGETIGNVVDTTAQQLGGKIPEVDEAIQELKAEASKYNSLTSQRNADARAELTDLTTRMEALQNVGKLDFRGLQDLKSDLGQAYHNPNLQNTGIDKAYGILSDTMDKILDRTTVSNPEMKEGFNKAKEVYKLTSNLMPAMKRGVSREVAGTGGGLSSAALGAGALFGHPVAAGVGYAGKTAAKLAAPDLAPNLAYKAMNAMKNSPQILNKPKQGITQEIIDYVNSKRNPAQ